MGDYSPITCALAMITKVRCFSEEISLYKHLYHCASCITKQVRAMLSAQGRSMNLAEGVSSDLLGPIQFILALGENHIYLWLVIRIVYALQTGLVSHSLLVQTRRKDCSAYGEFS